MTSTQPRFSSLLCAKLGHRAFFFGVALSILSSINVAQATIIADWTFENAPQPSGTSAADGPFSPATGSGSASELHASASTVYSSPAGNGSTHSFSSTMWAVGDYYQFQVSTAGLDDVGLSWDQTSSSTGPKDYELQYSTDGSTFTNFLAYSVLANASPNPVWNATTSSSIYSFAVDLSSITAIDDQAAVYFRLVDADTISAGGGTVGTSGTDRVDNVAVSGSPVSVPEPNSVFLALLGGVGIGLVSIRRPWIA